MFSWRAAKGGGAQVQQEAGAKLTPAPATPPFERADAAAPPTTAPTTTATRANSSIDKHLKSIGSLSTQGAKAAANAAAAGGDTLLKAGKVGAKVGGAGVGCLARCGTGFSDFFLRSSIVDMAVGVVLGFSFQALIEALVEAFLTPLLGAIFGATDWSTLSFEINNSRFQYGAFINSLLTFILVVLSCYFFIVAPMEKMMAIKNKKRYVTRDCPFCISEIPIGATRCAQCCADLPELTAEEAERLANVNPLAVVGTAFEGATGLANNVVGGVSKVIPDALLFPGAKGGKAGKKDGKKGAAAVATAAAAAAAAGATAAGVAAAAASAADNNDTAAAALAAENPPADAVALDVRDSGLSSSGGGDEEGPALRRRDRLRARLGRGPRPPPSPDVHAARLGVVAQEIAEASALREASMIQQRLPPGWQHSFSGAGGEGEGQPRLAAASAPSRGGLATARSQSGSPLGATALPPRPPSAGSAFRRAPRFLARADDDDDDDDEDAGTTSGGTPSDNDGGLLGRP
jgi:large conductance mechanosensitive channel